MNVQDTICAIATAQGGAIGIIRVSGPEAISATDRIFRPTGADTPSLSGRKAYTLAFGSILDPETGETVDEVLVSLFRAPHSYTGEDATEISCHGSSYILQRVMQLLLRCGCRAAGPGEFTQRAFLHGKMDLSQAEAVADLIASTSAASHRLAMNQMRGGFSRQLAGLRDQLLHLTSLMELELDFSDHEELEFADRSELSALTRRIEEVIRRLTESFRMGNALKNGIPVAIIGATNAGKSTLLNAITGADIPANNRLFDTLDTTTRLLTVSDTLDVVISDTVGFIRKLPHQLVEAFKATLEELEYADLLLHVIDSSNIQWRQQARIVDDLIRELGADTIPCIRVYNKSDLSFPGDRAKEEDAVAISAKTGEGIPALLAAIDKKLDKGTRRVTLHLPYDKAGLLDSLYREAKVESVEYAATVDVVAVCNPRLLGQLRDYIEGWQPPKEDWE